MEETELPWSVIDIYFRDNPSALVQHHLNSFNDFFDKGIERIIRENNPITIMKGDVAKSSSDGEDYKHRIDMYVGGKKGNKLYFGKPVIYDGDDLTNERIHYMYPNEARLRNMTYGVTIHYDLEVDYSFTESDGKVSKRTEVVPKVLLGRFPIMLMSDLCLLRGLEPRARFAAGECRNDQGGYFIIDGKEKVVISQEKFADNMLYVQDKGNELYSHIAKIRSVSEDTSKQVRTVSVSIVKPSPKYSNNQIVVSVPNVRKPVPLFILMRALGVESDKDIIKYCLLDLDKYKHYIDLFIPSVHDAGTFFTQQECLKYIALLTKHKTIPYVFDILMNYFLPHVGELNFQDKAYFVGYMVRELLSVFIGEKKATDRDNFKFKRIELTGALLHDLFREYYKIQQNLMLVAVDRSVKNVTFDRIEDWSMTVTADIITKDQKQSLRSVEEGFRKAFKGNWGSEAHTKREGIVQDLNRLSFNSFISHLRKINLPLDASAKVVGPRMLHCSQWGLIDPVDTPDGANIGLHKHMAIAAQITSSCPGKGITEWMFKNTSFIKLQESNPAILGSTTKIFVNGNWIGNTPEPENTVSMLKQHRRLGLIPVQTSSHWHIESNSIYIYTDGGRLCRPIYYIDKKNNKPSYMREGVIDKILSSSASWTELITGFGKKKDELFDHNRCIVYSAPEELYSSRIEKLDDVKAPIEFIDSAEEETALIAIEPKQLSNDNYTHLEIHPSLILGVMGNQIVFPENNQLPRDLFSCGQSKQGISVYHSNFQTRIDKTGIVLNYGQIPIVKSRYMEYINQEQHPYGENLIVAIMCYGGYNTEDAILFNGGSVARGMLRTTYYNMYEATEKTDKVAGKDVATIFANIQEIGKVIGTKPGYDYAYLNEYGLIKENTVMDDKKVVIGRVTTSIDDPETFLDSSIYPKKGQKGFVDKAFITDEGEGKRLAKIRIREERVPAIGDKFCSRCGQKGTCGFIIEEKDMPFTAEGIRPDIIINPHALPSRMTIGQLVETVMGKACSLFGAFGDCTAFSNKGPKQKEFGDLLMKMGFHSSGNEQLYNGMTGEQMEMSIFIGPTYYMRLKQMVKDKINYRARGPRTVLTRQTVQGRANDGGLRVGEMERDGIIAHGLSAFLEESLMVRGDEYYVAICNTTGTIAIYNQSRDIFLSPMADGPLRYTRSLEGNLSIDNISRFGKTFSIVRIPYALKLLIQELQTMNVQMRLITEDNVDQLTSMESVRNLKQKLGLSDESPIADVGNQAKALMRPSEYSISTPTIEETEIDKQSPEYKSDNMNLEDEQEINLPYYGEDENKDESELETEADREADREDDKENEEVQERKNSEKEIAYSLPSEPVQSDKQERQTQDNLELSKDRDIQSNLSDSVTYGTQATGEEKESFVGGRATTGGVNININLPRTSNIAAGGQLNSQRDPDDTPEEVEQAISLNSDSISNTVSDAKATNVSIITDPLPSGLEILTSLDKKDETEEEDEANTNSKNVTLEN